MEWRLVRGKGSLYLGIGDAGVSALAVVECAAHGGEVGGCVEGVQASVLHREVGTCDEGAEGGEAVGVGVSVGACRAWGGSVMRFIVEVGGDGGLVSQVLVPGGDAS